MIKSKWLKKKVLFTENDVSWEEAGIIIVGVPLDGTSSYRPGSRFAPQEIRRVFECLEEYSLDLNGDIRESRVLDAGDLILPGGNIGEGLARAEEIVRDIVRHKKIPFLIGGEHTITLAPVKALLSCGYNDLAVLHFDAHLDLREDYLGEDLSHASVIYRLIKNGVKDVYQFGIRSAASEEILLAREKTNYYPHRVLGPLKKVIAEIKDRPVYVTIDIDVVDPGYAPGTGTPEPGGITSSQLLRAVKLLEGVNVVGFDLVEVSPPYDYSQITAILGAKIIREAVLAIDKRQTEAVT